MNMSDNLFDKIKLIINGIAGIILFFITPTGIVVFTALLLLYFLLKVINSLKTHSLTVKAAGKKTGGPGYTLERISIFFLESFKFLGRIISNLPVLLGVIAIFLLIVGTAGFFKEYDNYLENEKKIKEMRTVLKHLDKRHKVADIDVTGQKNNISFLHVSFYDYAELGTHYITQDIDIKGSDIYFDSIVLNFEYSEISQGKSINIAIPYRVFSEEVSQIDGIELRFMDENGIPSFFRRPDDEIYGLDEQTYTSRLKQILSFVHDKKAAKDAGIRSIYGNAVHKKVKKGDFLSIWIEQTGGLVLKQGEKF